MLPLSVIQKTATKDCVNASFLKTKKRYKLKMGSQGRKESYSLDTQLHPCVTHNLNILLAQN